MPTFYALVDAMTGREDEIEAELRADARVLALARVKERNYDMLIKFEAAGFSLVDEFLQTNVRRIPGVAGVEIIMDWADHSEALRDAKAKLG